MGIKDAKVTDENLIVKQKNIIVDQKENCENKIKKIEEIKVDSFSLDKEMEDDDKNEALDDGTNNGEEPVLVDDKLPKGWSRSVIKRKGGNSKGKYDVYIHGHSKRFRSSKELETFCTENKVTELDTSTVDWTPFGKKCLKEKNKEKMTNKTQEDNKNDKLSNSSGEQIKKLVKKKESVNNKFKKSLITQNSFKAKGKLVPKTKKSIRDEKAKKVIEKAKKLLDKKTKKTTNVKEETKKLKKENNSNNKGKKTLNKGKGESDSQPENKNNKKINKYEKLDSTKKVDGNLNIAYEVKSVAKKAIEDEQKEAEIKNNKVDINIKCSPEKENNEKMKVENKMEKTSEYKLMTESVKVNNFSEPILHSKEKGGIGGKDEKNLPDEQSDTSIDKTEEIIISPLKTRSKNKGISPRKTRSRKDGKLSRIISKSKIMKRNGLKLIKKKLNNVFDEKKDIKSTLPDVNGLTSVSNKTKDDDAHLFKVPSLPCLQKALRFNGLKKIKSEPSMKMINHAEEKIRKEEAALEQVKNDNIEISNRITRNNKETSIKDYFSKDKTRKETYLKNDKKQSDNKVSDF